MQYLWQQTSGPSVVLDAAQQAITGFVVPEVSVATDLVFSLTVTNGQTVETGTNTIQVVVPIAAKQTETTVDDEVEVNQPVSGGGNLWYLLLLMMTVSQWRCQRK